MSLNTKDLTVLNAHTKYKGNTKTAHLFHKQMLATLSKSNQKISRFIHSGVITDKNNQQLEDGTGPEATLALSNATLDFEWFIWNELVANIDHWATLQKLEKRYGPQDDQGPDGRSALAYFLTTGEAAVVRTPCLDHRLCRAMSTRYCQSSSTLCFSGERRQSLHARRPVAYGFPSCAYSSDRVEWYAPFDSEVWWG